MQSSVLRVYSIIFNIVNIVKKKRNIKIDVLVYKGQFEKVREYYKIHCKRIFNEIENSFYSYKDLKLFVLYSYLFVKWPNIKNINKKNIKEVKLLFSKNRLEEDKKYFLEINKRVKLNDLEKYFIIKEGVSIVYNLIKKKLLSPIFWIKYSSIVDNFEGESIEHKYFRRICNLIKSILTERS